MASRSASVYGLIALGFVLVYKATEVVNFAQGDLMMLGGFLAFTFIGILGRNYWIGFVGAVLAMAAFGMLAERLVVIRRQHQAAHGGTRNEGMDSQHKPAMTHIHCATSSPRPHRQRGLRKRATQPQGASANLNPGASIASLSL